MTTLATTASAPARYGFRQAARMEWVKLRTLRSTFYALLLTVVSMVAIGVVTMANTKAPSPDKAATFDPTNNVLAGVALGQLLIGVLGVLIVTGEYSSGSIRSTLAVLPDRRLLLTAKACVYGGVVLLVGEVVAFLTFFAGRAALAAGVPRPDLGDAGVLRAVLMSGAYLGMIGLMGLGIGAIIRHTASAIASLVGVTFVLPALIGGISGPTVAKYFPTMIAGNSLAVTKPVSDMLAPWTGFAVLCLYTAVVLGVGARLLARRDA
ncbi:ABC transporter permease subunit [Streptomyces spectabilis]|uniref:ABC transporter permease n=1 Tax=Streptomyces spectabilis TaxID=68270 RepID=A0A5P2XK46_STRST|nr:ABC transporter permease [Streptomyces spectabilis]MBB5102240.1 ABC-type transport system involved in multi-copper enzyme maturation permease subunit [Streptomyces spectabilis]MCI3907288.1 ABC transporter permease [Streptomyces spectabilis]QEV64024.1 ABC transporter permease [Streptomyces spectabilis]GGV29657.1 ABC transporter permease [Streptomyces spectabilis]